MIDFKEYIQLNQGKQVIIATTTGTVRGTLIGNKSDTQGNVVALVVHQYLHKIDVPAEDILNVRLMPN